MNRRAFLKATGIGVTALSLNSSLNISCSSQKKKPNILFFFTDDQRFDTINALNNEGIKTPNIDRLVRNGVTFTRAHIMGGNSGAICMPSRAMLMTGKNLFHLKNRGNVIPEDHMMLPELLMQYKYQTFGTGKWHNSPAAYARCFTAGGKVMFGGMSDHLKVPIYDFDPSGKYPKENQYFSEQFSSEMFSDEAINFLENYQFDNPFFMYISYTAPHDPRMAPEEYTIMYDPADIKLPLNFMPKHPFDNGEMVIRDEMLAPLPRTPDIIKEHIASYYAMITHVDFHIGRVLDTLEKSGEFENTIIVFAGDNGLAVGQHGLLGKQNLYEHSVRVPLIFCGPGIPKNKQADTLCYIHSIFPTLCELIGLEIPQSVESVSLAPALKNQDENILNSVFYAYKQMHRGVRVHDNWKLIKYNVKGKITTQLFNLNEDPWEISNLADDEKYKLQQAELTELLKNYMQELHDFCDLDKPNWGLQDEKIERKNVSHLAKGKNVTLLNNAQIKYSFKGLVALTDGVRASSNFDDGNWVGVEGDNLEVVIDLGRLQKIKKVTIGFLENQSSWIFYPNSIELSISHDGEIYSIPAKNNFAKPKPNQFKKIKTVTHPYKGKTTKFLKVKIENIGLCPKWHQGFGKKAWVFIDEIVVK